jgi:hypothetical protein
MLIDPVQEWRRLTEHYRSLANEELRELAFTFADLTETAQQVLRDELRLRGLRLPLAMTEPANAPSQRARSCAAWPDSGDSEESAQEAEDEEVASPHEYTWLTKLCECETAEQAWQLYEVLRRAGIRSLTQTPQSGLIYHRVLVPADQLDEARVIAARPIPQDVVDESKQTVPEFVVPACPCCGAEDPLLANVDPVNLWRCEFCGCEWTDPTANPTGAIRES